MKRRLFLLAAVSLACVLALSTASASAPNWDVSGTWTGSSGLVGNLVFTFNMDLDQASGDVTGTIEYTNYPATRSVVGYVDGNDFYFTTSDAGYWATCWPCTISADGKSFAGEGVDSNVKDVGWQASGQAARIAVIDIKPGGYPNCFNINGHGVIPVAILGRADFDVTQIDVSTLSFGGLDVRVKGKGTPQCSVGDVSGDSMPQGSPDGFDDLVCQFVDDAGAWTTDDGMARLTGALLDGTPIEGSDEICLRPE